MAKIIFNHQNIQVDAQSGTEFTELKDVHPDLPLKFGCRTGHCGICAIRILEGKKNLSKQADKELQTLESKGLNDSFRLACQCAFNGPVVIE